jgi:hypothetical protein
MSKSPSNLPTLAFQPHQFDFHVSNKKEGANNAPSL